MVTVKRLLFRRVVFTDWDVVLDRGGVCQHLTICRHVLHVDRALLDFWGSVLFVDVDNVLRAFRYHARSRGGRLAHFDEVIAVKRLLFRLVLFADWGIVLNARHIF